MKNVLVVSYVFPPTGGAGVQRPAKFVKYLPKFGYTPYVLTVKNPSVPINDKQLLSDLPDELKIYYAKTLEPSYQSKEKLKSQSDDKRSGPMDRFKGVVKKLLMHVLLPDVQILWWPSLLLSIRNILKTEQIHAVFVTAPPFSSLVPVVMMGKRFKVPVIADFRDEWTFSRNVRENMPKSPVGFWIDRILERYVIKNCTEFTAATDSYVSNLRSCYNTGKGIAITNGFDAEDFIDIEKSPSDKGSPLKIVYTGTIWQATSLKPLVEALTEKCSSGDDLWLKDISLTIAGRITAEEEESIRSLGKRIKVNLCGYLSHREVLKLIVNADVLLLTLSTDPGSERIIPGKTFEYMATCNHILSITPEGETSRILKENYSSCTQVDPTNIDEIRSAVKDLRSQVQLIRDSSISSDQVMMFERRFLTERLAHCIDSLAI